MSEPSVDRVLTALHRVYGRFLDVFAELGDEGATLPSDDDDWSVEPVWPTRFEVSSSAHR